jgi:hypothetical protein
MGSYLRLLIIPAIVISAPTEMVSVVPGASREVFRSSMVVTAATASMGTQCHPDIGF